MPVLACSSAVLAEAPWAAELAVPTHERHSGGSRWRRPECRRWALVKERLVWWRLARQVAKTLEQREEERFLCGRWVQRMSWKRLG